MVSKRFLFRIIHIMIIKILFCKNSRHSHTCQIESGLAVRIWSSVEKPSVGEDANHKKVYDKRTDESKSRLDRVVLVSFLYCSFIPSVDLKK